MRQTWQSHHTICHDWKPHAACKLHGSIFYRTWVIADRSFTIWQYGISRCVELLKLVTFINELHLYPLKMYSQKKIEPSTSRLSKTIVLQTDRQERARDVKARDRDDTETLASPAEMRPRRDVKISRRDVCSFRDVRGRDDKVQVLLTAITGLDVIFHVYCFWRVNMMSNSNYSIGLQRLKPVHTAYCGLHNLAKNWYWARDVNGRDREVDNFSRDETLIRLETETTTLQTDVTKTITMLLPGW